jgi:hypothetical protein
LPRLQVRAKAREQKYEIHIGRGVLSDAGGLARILLGKLTRAVACRFELKLFSRSMGLVFSRVCKRMGLRFRSGLIGEGERAKSLRTCRKTGSFPA